MLLSAETEELSVCESFCNDFSVIKKDSKMKYHRVGVLSTCAYWNISEDYVL